MAVEHLRQKSFNPLYIAIFQIEHCLKGCILGNVFQAVYTWSVTKLYTVADFARILSKPRCKLWPPPILLG